MKTNILITTGDLDGVGLEVTLKSLQSIDTNKDTFIIFCAYDLFLKQKKLCDFNLKFNVIDSLSNDLPVGIYLYSPNNSRPVDWFKLACEFCDTNNENSVVVTGPLSKKSFNSNTDLGHTAYLRATYPKKNIFMTFFSELFTCLLLTDHLPLAQVPSAINYDLLQQAHKTIQFLSKFKKIALLGLNPHAGEDGLIGNEETLIHSKFIANHHDFFDGPFPADGFFLDQTYKKYDYIFANYHDQGLIPFKLMTGFNSAQSSLGLPFIRTSVDHGTAQNIFEKNLADPRSMSYAIMLAKKLLEKKNAV